MSALAGGRLPKALAAFALACAGAFAVWFWLGRAVPVADAPGERVPCVSYAPYRDGQSPFDETLVIPRAQIEDDLRHLAAYTDCVRTYAVDQGMDAVPEVAAGLGLKVMLGAWIGRETAKNERQLATAIDLANRLPGTVIALIVGNEVLLRREQPPDRLAALIRDARARVRVPVTYADVWEFWLKHPEVAEAVDFVTVHMLPYWEDEPTGIDGAIAHVFATWQRVAAVFPGKPVFIGEAGWPSAGRMREAALPSPVNEARFVRELLQLAAREGIGVNVIEAFDQRWKRKLEGTVGGAWGLFTAEREAKFALKGAVADRPDWLARWLAAAALAALPVGLALLAGWRSGFPGWLTLAVAAQAASGLMLTATAEALSAAVTPLDRLAAYAQLALAGASFALVAIALAGNSRLPAADTNAGVLARLARRAPPGVSDGPAWLGLVRLSTLVGAAAITLALIFDPRYRDFPTAAYAVPAAAFLALALVRPDGNGASREDALLAGVLAVGGVIVVVREGWENFQALAWAVVALALAASVRLSSRTSPVPSEAQRPEEAEEQAERAGAGAV